MIPFYDKWFWFEDGFEKTLLHIMSVLSVVAIIAAVLICIFSLIKYFSYNKEVKAYRAANPTLPKHGANLKVTIPVLAAALVACLILSPIMEDIDTKAYNVYLDQSSSKSDSTQYSDLVEKRASGEWQFKYTIKEYVNKFNKVTNSEISVKSAELKKSDKLNSYIWNDTGGYTMITTYSDNDKIFAIDFNVDSEYYEEYYDDIVDTVISAFSIIDDEVDTDKIEEMLDNAMYIKGYQDFYCSNEIKYMVDCSESSIDISTLPEKMSPEK